MFLYIDDINKTFFKSNDKVKSELRIVRKIDCIKRHVFIRGLHKNGYILIRGGV